MLVDINLLPKRDEKNIAIYVIAVSIVVVLIIVTVFFVVHLNAKKQELQNLNQ